MHTEKLSHKGSTGQSESCDESIVRHSTDGDLALELVKQEGERVVIDEATNKRLLRRIDMMMMPVRRQDTEPEVGPGVD